MTKEEFFGGMREFRRACDLDDSPRKEVMAVWYRHLGHVSVAEWKVVVNRLIRTADGFPRNFVQAVSGYVEPQKQKPLDFGDLRPSTPEDEEAARECFAQLARVGLVASEEVVR